MPRMWAFRPLTDEQLVEATRRELALKFANTLSQETLIELIEASYGRYSAEDYRLWLSRTGWWMNCEFVPSSAEPIMLTCDARFTDLIEAREGGTATPVGVDIDAYNGGPMTIKGYPSQVVIDISGIEGLGRSVPILRDHNHKKIVGHGMARAVDNMVNLKGQLHADNEGAQEIIKRAREGFPWQASVGVQPLRLQHLQEDEIETVNGTEFEGPLVLVRDGILREVSIVAMGADTTTQTRVAAGADGSFPMIEFSANGLVVSGLEASVPEFVTEENEQGSEQDSLAV